MKYIITLLCGFIITINFNAFANDKKLKTEKGRLSYALGIKMASVLKNENIEIDKKIFLQAIEDVLDNKKYLLTDNEISSEIKFLNEKRRQKHEKKQKAEALANLEAGNVFLKRNKLKDGVKVTKSGLQYKIIKQGEGLFPKATDIVKVHYKGTLINGTEFDNSYKRQEPTEFPLNRVISGWSEGLQLMKVGSIYEFYIPAKLGYGSQNLRDIPANSVLIFKVELLDITSK